MRVLHQGEAVSREAFPIKTVTNPFSGVRSARVIAGSDQRVVAHGATTLAPLLGASISVA